MATGSSQSPDNAPARRRHHRKPLGEVLKVVAPLAVTIALVWWLLHKVNIHQIHEALEQPTDFLFIALMMLLTLTSHVIRGIRWGIQLRAAGIPRISPMAESCSIFGAYALNVIFPYLGEAWRCVYISRRENVKLSTVVGTDLGDRISDLIVILMLTGLTLIVAHPAMETFFRMVDPKTAVSHSFDDSRTYIIIGIVIGALVAAWLIGRHSSFEQGLKASAIRLYRGFAVLFHMKGTGAYILLTLGIWTCYFFQTYFCLFAFPYTRELVSQPGMYAGFLPALVVFVFGSCSMAIPSNGGLGPWNIAVVLGLSLYGISTADATAWSLVYWGWQTVAQIIGGVIAAIYIGRKRRHHPAPTAS